MIFDLIAIIAGERFGSRAFPPEWIGGGVVVCHVSQPSILRCQRQQVGLYCYVKASHDISRPFTNVVFPDATVTNAYHMGPCTLSYMDQKGAWDGWLE